MDRALCIVSLLVAAGCEVGSSPALGTSDGTPLVVSLTQSEIGVGGPRATPLTVRVEGSSADTTYRTTWTVGATACLQVVPRAGEPVIHRGTPMVADYYHMGRVLGVAIGPQGQQDLYGYVEPISFRTIACPP